MKFAAVLTLLLLANLRVTGQDTADPYTNIMRAQTYLLDTIAPGADLRPTLATFERIERVEADRWLPPYYVALCYSTLAYEADDLDEVDLLCDKAELALRRAEERGGDASEILTVRALTRYARLRVNYMSRGKEQSERALQELTQASRLDPDNPRAYAMLAQHYLNVPPQLGGNRDRACQYARLALEAFEQEAAANTGDQPILPHWGKKDLKKTADRFCATLNKKKKK